MSPWIFKKEERKKEEEKSIDRLMQICYEVLDEAMERGEIEEDSLEQMANEIYKDIINFLPISRSYEMKVFIGHGKESIVVSLQNLEEMENQLKDNPVGRRNLYHAAVGLLMIKSVDVDEEEIEEIAKRMGTYARKFMEVKDNPYDFGSTIANHPKIAINIVRKYKK